MSYAERCELYEKIENIRERPLLSYITSIRPNASGNISIDIIPEIIKHINLVPKSERNVDVLIVSNGGDPVASWRIMSILRERFTKIGVITPFVAYSAATLLALGADEILMHPFSNLGPVDPQITANRQGVSQNFSTEDVKNYMEFVKKDVGITDQEHLAAALSSMCQEVGPFAMGSARRSNSLTMSLGEKMLRTHMSDQSKAQRIVSTLNSAYFHHGYALGRREAKEIGLKVSNVSPSMEEYMWDIWEDFSDEMKCHENFSVNNLILNDSRFDFLKEYRRIEMPVGIPANISGQIMQNLSIQHSTIEKSGTVDYDITYAILESMRAKSGHTKRIVVAASRNPIDLSINANAAEQLGGWIFTKNEQLKEGSD